VMIAKCIHHHNVGFGLDDACVAAVVRGANGSRARGGAVAVAKWQWQWQWQWRLWARLRIDSEARLTGGQLLRARHV